MTKARPILAALALMVLALLAERWYAIVWNDSPSMPFGMYFVNKTDHAPRRGEIVLLQPNAVAAAYDARYHGERGIPFLKHAIAVAGDTVTFTRQGVIVDGAAQPDSRAILSLHRHALPKISFGHYYITRGYAWGWTPVWDSFDSRYYGPLQIEGVANPLFTWGNASGTPPPHVRYR